MAKVVDTVSAREAKHGQKMIEVKLRFWTDGIATEKGKVVPKHAWTSGVVRVTRNDAHGIKPGQPIVFHSLLEIGAAVEKLIIEQGIVLHPGRKDKKYLSDHDPAW